ncbi:hypothetical protein CK203_110904 [Vitis vinifera]|uniref:Retrotransposon gag domain-containing protein n=1 Tax=Vitis vinifera TaxID=29760 RepID=A0A438CEB5_VITVI|nr:hypothetical protein CK203_110904 [Vitis vinifera]
MAMLGERHEPLQVASVINFVDYSLNQRAPVGHESTETPIGNESNGAAAGKVPTSYDIISRYMEAINACPHHGFDTWLLVSYFYDGMCSSMKQLLETMCGGDFMSKNPDEAMDFLSYVAEVSREWDELHRGEVGKMKSQPNALHAKAGMYTLNEDVDMKAKFATMTRRVEELELKKMNEGQDVTETPVQVKPCSICQSYEHLVEECPPIPVAREMYREQANFIDNSSPIAMLRMAILTTQVGGIIQIFHGSQEHLSTNSRLNHLNHPNKASSLETSNSESQQENTLNKRMDVMQNDLSQKIDNLQYSISRLTNLNTVRDVKALITLRSGKKVESPTPKPYVEEKKEEGTKKMEEMKGKKKDISEGKEDRDSTMNANPEKELIKEELMKKRNISTFSSSFAWEKGDKKCIRNP